MSARQATIDRVTEVAYRNIKTLHRMLEREKDKGFRKMIEGNIVEEKDWWWQELALIFADVAEKQRAAVAAAQSDNLS